MPVAVNTFWTGFPVGAVDFYYAAKVEHLRQGALPRPAPLFSSAVVAPGDAVMAAIVPGIQYVAFGADGKGRLVMAGMGQPTIETITPAAGTGAKTLVVDGYGFSVSSRVRVDGRYLKTRFKSQNKLEADLPAQAAGARAITVENAGYVTNAKTYTAS